MKKCISTCFHKGMGVVSRKIGRRSGLSLMEMMLCVLILVFASAVITNTLVLGINQFKARTRETEACLLCNVLSLAVQDQLTYVREVMGVDDEGNLIFRSSAEGFQDVQCQLLRSNAGRLYMKYTIGGKSTNISLADDAAYVSNDVRNDLSVQNDFSIEVVEVGDDPDGKFKVFQVKLTVDSAEHNIQPATNTFTVKPIFNIN